MKPTRKKDFIDEIVQMDIDNILLNSDGQSYLRDLITNGFKGYSNYTLKELKQEYNERIN